MLDCNMPTTNGAKWLYLQVQDLSPTEPQRVSHQRNFPFGIAKGKHVQQRWRRCHKLKYIEVEHLFSKRVSISIYSASGLRRTLNGARYHERESAKRPPGTLNETKCRENAEGLGAPHLDSRRDAVRVDDYWI